MSMKNINENSPFNFLIHTLLYMKHTLARGRFCSLDCSYLVRFSFQSLLRIVLSNLHLQPNTKGNAFKKKIYIYMYVLFFDPDLTVSDSVTVSFELPFAKKDDT